MKVKIAEWWEAQNTGWSGGMSWFNSGGSTRFESKEEAMAFNRHCMKSYTDSSTNWRVVKVIHTEQIYPMKKIFNKDE